MPTRPPAMRRLLAPFAPPFSRRVWPHAVMLIGGTIRAPGRRTGAAAVRALGLDQQRRFARDHRVLNRARWSNLAVSRPLLRLLVGAFVGAGPLSVGIDETIERRRGTPGSAAAPAARDRAGRPGRPLRPTRRLTGRRSP